MLEVLNTLRGNYNKAFTPFQANVLIFLPPEHFWLCVFMQYKIGILARDGLTFDGISDTTRNWCFTFIPPENTLCKKTFHLTNILVFITLQQPHRKIKYNITRYFRKPLKWNVTLNNTNIDVNKFHKSTIMIKKCCAKEKEKE